MTTTTRYGGLIPAGWTLVAEAIRHPADGAVGDLIRCDRTGQWGHLLGGATRSIKVGVTDDLGGDGRAPYYPITSRVILTGDVDVYAAQQVDCEPGQVVVWADFDVGRMTPPDADEALRIWLDDCGITPSALLDALHKAGLDAGSLVDDLTQLESR